MGLFEGVLSHLGRTKTCLVRSELIALVVVFYIDSSVLVKELFCLRVMGKSSCLRGCRCSVHQAASITTAHKGVCSHGKGLLTCGRLTCSIAVGLSAIRGSVAASGHSRGGTTLGGVLSRILSVMRSGKSSIISDFNVVLSSSKACRFARSDSARGLHFVTSICKGEAVSRLARGRRGRDTTSVVRCLYASRGCKCNLSSDALRPTCVLGVVGVHCTVTLGTCRRCVSAILTSSMDSRATTTVVRGGSILANISVSRSSVQGCASKVCFTSVVKCAKRVSRSRCSALSGSRGGGCSLSSVMKGTNVRRDVSGILRNAGNRGAICMSGLKHMASAIDQGSPRTKGSMCLAVSGGLRRDACGLLRRGVTKVILSGLRGILRCSASDMSSSGGLVVPIDSTCCGLVKGSIVSSKRFSDDSTGATRRQICSVFRRGGATAVSRLRSRLRGSRTDTCASLSGRVGTCVSCVYSALLAGSANVLVSSRVSGGSTACVT